MQLKTITQGYSVSTQLTAADLGAVQASGHRSVICNRPDGEASHQPAHEEIERACRERQLEFRYIPIRGGTIGEDDVRAFDQALRELPGPILAYCRTGTRSTRIWALAEAKRRPLPEILKLTRAAGYDMGRVAGAS